MLEIILPEDKTMQITAVLDKQIKITDQEVYYYAEVLNGYKLNHDSASKIFNLLKERIDDEIYKLIEKIINEVCDARVTLSYENGK